MKVLYSTQMINNGGRNGQSFSPDGSFSWDVATPKEMGGNNTKATNPEQLFAAGYGACFHGALELVLSKARVTYESSKVTATVSLIEDPVDKGFKIAVRMQVSIKGLDKETTEKYVKLAHTVCPYSKATKGNIDVELEVV